LNCANKALPGQLMCRACATFRYGEGTEEPCECICHAEQDEEDKYQP
jgi:hypothetical protein